MARKQSSRTPDPQERLYIEETPDRRSPSERDRDRILYASSFARLAEITQVVSPEKGYVFHNRLTHSLKVAQISRRIAEALLREQPDDIDAIGGLDPNVAEAAGLAHDLGHPPFGHIAEYELNKLTTAAGARDGYEGNAQSFRIVAMLATSDARNAEDLPIAGLNLTRATLHSILKYPWRRGRSKPYSKKWGYYDTEEAVFNWVTQDRPPEQRSLAAEIMDWADDITFAIHDLLDFYCAGKIPIDRCKHPGSAELNRMLTGMFKRKPEWERDRQQYVEALEAIVEWFPIEAHQQYSDSSDDRAQLFDCSTGLIRHFVEAIKVRSRDELAGPLATVDPEVRRIVEVLKQFIWEYVIQSPDLAVPQQGQRLAISTVFRRLISAAEEKHWYIFPAGYRSAISQASTKHARARVVADCISGMTEKELLHLYRCGEGIS